MKRRISSLALMFLSMSLTLHLTDQVVRHSQEIPPSEHTLVAERCSPYLNVWSLPSGGLGALVECEPAGIRLVTCLPGHAGLQSGLRVGDRIIAIDGESTRGCNEAWAVSRLRGKIGTRVVLDVERGEGIWQRTFRAIVERKNIETEYSVYSRLRGNELVIKVHWLGPKTAEQLASHLNQLSTNGIDNLVLDLSNLSSGDLNSLQECASLFLPQGTVIGEYQHLQNDGEPTKLVTQGHPFTDKLTSVKVGPYTAKVGELYARALADNLNVKVEGEATAGLGTIDGRTIRSRSSSSCSGMELFDSNGDSIDGQPLKPDFWSWSTLSAPVASGLE